MDATQIEAYLEKTAHNWLNNQKDTLLLQLVGFIMDGKAKLEEKYGSGVVQKEIMGIETSGIVDENQAVAPVSPVNEEINDLPV